jgi:RNA polymerase sigma factor (sigma-70 family)
MERLLRQHDGLVPWVIQRDCRSDLPYAELVHEGQIALWQAIMHYDPGRGVAFSSYAVPVIRHRLWRLVRETQRPQGHGMLAAADDPAELAAQAWQRQAVRAALKELLAHLPERSYHVMVSAYGLDGETPLSLAEIGRLLGLSRERVRQLRNDALALLRLPALSGSGWVGAITRRKGSSGRMLVQLKVSTKLGSNSRRSAAAMSRVSRN